MDYKREQALDAINSVAQLNGIPADEVYREIALAIDLGLTNPDPQIQEKWRSLSCLGDRLAPEDVILYAIDALTDYANDLTTAKTPYGPECELNKAITAEEEGA